MNTLDFFLKRLLKAAFVVLGVVVFNFLLIHLAPGDPATVIAGESGAGDAQFLAQLRQQFGLDQPLYVQLWLYVKGVLSFNMGFSYRNNLPVSELILERLPATLLLSASAFVLSLLLGILLGVMAAARRGKLADSLIMSGALLFYATPLFWVSLMAMLVFSIRLDWLPPFGMETIGGGLTGTARAWDVLQHMVLPVATLGLFFTAIYTRLTRASMLEVASLDFVKTARAKGVPRRQITRRHVLRNAMLPVFTFAGIQAGQILGGAVLTETVFAWPGIGRLMFDALIQRDYPVLMGVFLVTSALVVLVNLLTDVFYRFVDPRIEATA
ncbi:ABC transporter permease [Pseudorhodoferax soli]|jgi:peptide/nickel transport system permease protein|uniref:Peptide/nickel transport system permease protein n=1 Tax=Pseudorhodoferax soli TaxID=545864 RepID=A0A368Y893_9BURK|nr:ABC transporter permease [Pseudorhodoferax soli]RCW75556.1 peptide/nickel transport system permease protein [Pseudorhodoferax soli]